MADPARCGPVTRVCANCEHAMLNDFDKEFKMWPDRASGTMRAIPRNSSDFPTRFFLTDHLPDLSRLRNSAQQGCEFCGLLRALILSDDTRSKLRSEYKTDIASLGPSEININVIYRWNHRPWYFNEFPVNNFLIVKVDFGSDIQFDYWTSLNAVEGYDTVAKHLCLTKPPSQSYSDTGTVQWLKACIETCEKYRDCAPKGDYLPDRLLDTTDGKVRLVLRESLSTENPGFSPDYAALSYCWGTSEDAQFQLKTKRSSLAQRQAGIQMEDLLAVPALYDAVQMTRELEIPYLWIDSLCILQDDISDWERNCSSMDKVYGSAKVTLVAASSGSCREGFLRTKGQQLLLPYRSKTQPNLRGIIKLQFRFSLTGRLKDSSYFDFHNTPLSRRGWAVQERLMAARRIVFGPCDVHFICPGFTLLRGGVLKMNWDLTMSEVNNEQTSVLYGTWAKVVREYQYITAQSFTNPSDLLPALSGLAHCFNRRFQDEYCAGHWKKNLLTSLMWARENHSTISKTTHLQSHRSPVPYLLPSWSQLCKGDLCFFESTHVEGIKRLAPFSHVSHASEVEYLDWERSLLRNDPMGALTSAKLKIRTRIMKLPITKFVEVRHPQPHWQKIPPEEPPKEDWEKQNWVIICDDHGDTESVSLNIHLDHNSTKANVGSDMFGWKWVLMGSCSLVFPYDPPPRALRRSYEEYRYSYGLIVAPLWEDREEWCRVGIFTPERYTDFSLNNFINCSKIESISIV